MADDITALFGPEVSKWELAIAAALNQQPRTSALAELELIAEPARERVASILRKLQGLPLHWSRELSAQLLELRKER